MPTSKIPKACTSTLLLLDNRADDDTALRQITAIRKAAPDCIICCISTARDFYSSEEKCLKRVGVQSRRRA